MSSKRNFDNSFDEYSDENHLVLDDDFGHVETDGGYSETLENLDDSSKDSETSSTDEDSWQETDVSSVEHGSNTNGDQEPPRRCSKSNNQ